MRDLLIIGCGNIAGGLDAGRSEDALPFTHAGAFSRHGGYRLAACIDPDEARCEAFKRRWVVPAGARNLDGLQARPGDFDVVSVCSPTPLHAEHLEAVLALRPRLIFCEKPIAGTLSEAERLGARCAEAGVKLAVNYTRRWAPDVVRLGGDLRSGAWGAVRSATGIYTKGVVHNGGHMIDLIRLLLGDLKLVAAGAPLFDHWHDDPTVPALLVSEEGATVQLTPGYASDYAIFELTLVTERGTIAMLDAGRRWALRCAAPSNVFVGYRTLGDPKFVEGRYDEAMLAAAANIADALDHDAPLASTGENALAAQRLCETIRATALVDQASSARTIQ